MKIAFFTEGGYNGKVPRNNPNMRTDQAWICALDATHHCVFQLEQVTQKYDIGVVSEKLNCKISVFSFLESISIFDSSPSSN